MGKFWEGIGGKLAERCAAAAIPTAVFWLGGLLAFAFSRGGLPQVDALVGPLNQLSNAIQVAVLLTLVVAMAASAAVVGRLTTPALRLIEGYWPGWCAGLRRSLTARMARRAAADDADWQLLAGVVLVHPDAASAEQLAAFAQLDQRRHRRPAHPNRYLPTRVGNILRAAETWPTDKYGLDAVVVWPRLWMVLPDAARQELIASRAALDSAVAAAIWALLFCTFAVWTPLAVPLGLALAAIAVLVWVPPRAENFADLVETAYDLHRTALYQQLRWPLPTSPEEERGHGQQLTAYLWRGSDDPAPTFTPPS